MSESQHTNSSEVTRRDFLHAAAATGAGLVLAQGVWGAPAKPNTDELRVGVLGAGRQGRNLIMDALKIPGIRFVAVCDIWSYSQRYASRYLKKCGHIVNVYADYQDMLAKEKDMDAVIVATPDWMHAEHMMACLKAGKHVYSEKEMAPCVDQAKQMVAAARASDKLVQIGHQRRSNPRYWHAMRMIYKDKILGRITQCYGQWNRAVEPVLRPPRKYVMSPEYLHKYGYRNMTEFMNWRWFKKYSGGPICDLGSHQIDVFNWFLKCPPVAVMASGGRDYYKDREWYDTVMTIYEYHTAQGTVRAFYEVLNTTSFGGYYEAFIGDEGTLVISEDRSKGYVIREVRAKRRQWEDEADTVEKMGRKAIELKIGASRKGKKGKMSKLEADAKKPPHQLHLENFFDAIRAGDKSKLTCPPEVAYESTVTVLKVNDAIAAQKRLTFEPEEFKA